MRILREDASEWCVRERCKLDVLCMQEGSGQGLLLFRVEGGGGWCLSRLERARSLQQVQWLPLPSVVGNQAGDWQQCQERLPGRH